MGKHSRLPANDAAPEAAAPDVARVAHPHVRYYAFLSYSHKDEELAEWLHRELEEFRVPPALAGKLTANGVIPKRLAPIFRDEHELAAADDLGEEIEAALAASQFLIVLCSPAAAASHWTNAEIEAFKRTRPDGCVLAAIASGEPFASEMPGRKAEECFPPALRQKYDRRGRPTGKRAEPLAADLREEGEARRLGLLKLIAGMLGVGLDDLVQRETTRRHRRLAWLTAASLAGMAVTSTLAFTAIRSRDEAREQRKQAESLVEFMLGDLKGKLEPIGRLDALDGVGSRVLKYYHNQDITQLSDEALAQRSKALTLMGQVASQRGDLDRALALYSEAYAGTAEEVRRKPDDPQRLFDHAQNTFYLADVALQQGRLDTAEPAWRQYKDLASRMLSLDPNNMKWRVEEQNAGANLGVVLYLQRRFDESANQFQQSLRMIEALATADPRNNDYQKSLQEALSWLAQARMAQGQINESISLREQHVRLLTRLLAQSGDVFYRQKLVPAERSLGNLYWMRGDIGPGSQHFRAALDHSSRLLAVEPANSQWLEAAFQLELDFAQHLASAGRRDEAGPLVDAGCNSVRGLVAKDARVPAWRAGLRDCWMARSQLATSPEEALKDAQQAITVARTVHSFDRVSDAVALARSYRMVGDVERTLGNGAAARTAWSSAFAAFPKGIAQRPYEMSEDLLILQRLGRTAEARPIAARLDAMGYRTTV